MKILKIFHAYKVVGGIWLVIILFSLIAALSYRTTSHLVAKTEARKHAAETIALLEGVSAGLGDMNAGARDLVASGKEDDLALYSAAEKRTGDKAADLEKLVTGEPFEEQRFRPLLELVTRQMTLDRRAVDAYKDEGPDAARKLLQGADAKQLARDVRKTLPDMMDAEKELFVERDSVVSAGAKRTLAVVVYVNLLGMIVVVLSLVLAKREFMRRKQAEEQGQSFMATAAQTSDLVIVTDMTGAIEYANKAVEDATGYPVSKLVGKNAALLKSDDESEILRKKQQDALLSGHSFKVSTLRKKKDGGLLSLEETVTPLKDREGVVAHVVSTGKNITYEKTLEENVHQLTYYDAMTGLPRRALFIDMLSKELARAQAQSGTVAVMLASVDRLKSMTELFGFDAGDDIVKLVATRLAGSFVPGDDVFTARLGSDEFGILLKHISMPGDMMQAAKRVLKYVSQPARIRGEDILITVTVGVALSPADGEDAATLVKNAEAALSQAKTQGRNNFQFYSKDATSMIAERLKLEKGLFSALVNKEYLLNYQPYHELVSANIAGAEALIKWKHPVLGLLSPTQFIPALEDTGMIIDVGEWVLRTACQQLKDWDVRRTLFPVSVNLSGVQFRHKYLVDTVDSAIKDFNIDPTHLTLELTESIFMHDLNFAQNILKKLKDLGVAISVDDFGTGYSSLSYLKKLPVDTVKIDKSFINDVTTDPDAASIVTAITSMARSLNLKTIAEGVETEEQVKVLRLLRCDLGQGYYFNPALPPEELEKYLY